MAMGAIKWHRWTGKTGSVEAVHGIIIWGMPKSCINSELREWKRRKNLKNLKNFWRLQASKELCGPDDWSVRGTGNHEVNSTCEPHGRLNHHQNKVGLTQEDTCRLCQEEAETAFHEDMTSSS